MNDLDAATLKLITFTVTAAMFILIGLLLLVGIKWAWGMLIG